MTSGATPSQRAEPTVALPALVFDGDCGFCTTTARWAEERLGAAATVVPWQSLDLERYGLTVDQVTSAAYWISEAGRTHRGHLGVAEALVVIGGPWALAGRVMRHRPVSWLAALVYRLVARYRYRLPGATDACRIGP